MLIVILQLQLSRCMTTKKPSIKELEKRVLEVTLKTSGVEPSKVRLLRDILLMWDYFVFADDIESLLQW